MYGFCVCVCVLLCCSACFRSYVVWWNRGAIAGRFKIAREIATFYDVDARELSFLLSLFLSEFLRVQDVQVLCSTNALADIVALWGCDDDDSGQTAQRTMR